MKLIFQYYKEIQTFNIPFSLLIGFLGLFISGFEIQEFYATFLLCFASGGFVLSVYFYEVRYKEQYYFYYNRGFSKYRLIGLSFGVNFLLYIVLLSIGKLLS